MEVVMGPPGSAVYENEGHSTPLFLNVEFAVSHVDPMDGQAIAQPVAPPFRRRDLGDQLILDVNDPVQDALLRLLKETTSGEEWQGEEDNEQSSRRWQSPHESTPAERSYGVGH
jgi:hypothetical protein